MRLKFLPLSILFLITFNFSSCNLLENDVKKDNENDEETNMQVYAEQAQNAVLEVWTKAITQAKSNGRIESDSVGTDSLTEVCGIKATMNLKNVRPILTVNFGSFRCEYSNIVRQGQVTLEMIAGSSIENQYSIAKFTFIDFKVTDTETGKFVKFNGTKIITNLSGGVLTNLVSNQPELLHKVRSQNFHIFYSGSSGDIIKNTARFVKLSRLDFANNYRMITYGDTTINGIENVADWGTLRNGTNFYHIVKKPIFFESCSKRCRYVKGERIQKTVGGLEITTIFGVDKNGRKQQDCSAFGKLMYYFNAKGDSIGKIVKYN